VILFGPGRAALVNFLYVISFAWANQNHHSSRECDFLFILLFRPNFIIRYNFHRIYGFRVLVGPTKNVVENANICFGFLIGPPKTLNSGQNIKTPTKIPERRAKSKNPEENPETPTKHPKTRAKSQFQSAVLNVPPLQELWKTEDALSFANSLETGATAERLHSETRSIKLIIFILPTQSLLQFYFLQFIL
jgi:hypothetical protein